MAYKFRVGHVIHHKRYDYYGVIVNADGSCKADDSWYNRNKTQPDKKQPWYNVLVDGGNETYAAEENLEFDDTGRKIEHPLMANLFLSYHNGKYYQESLN